MIRIEHIQKYYNKSRQNEIHVINDTTLEFPAKGLVAITGPSGCGKTTLLNVIGGLDKFDAGKIDFDGVSINSYKPEQWDLIRNAYVGYIFQNYNLVEDKTVYENIAIALNMAGLYQPEAIEERINYVLRSVGMYNYRRRNVLALSGGQQQRVAIARAIAKNPKVVIADEPTGNLDANNTFEIMSIIKKISETCLVILVSHERDLVDFYADRVIEILDGKVVANQENSGNRTLEHVDDRNIYLKDLNLETSKELVDLSYYYDEKPAAAAGIKLIYLNNILYIKADMNTKIKYLSDETEIRLVDDHYRKPETDDISKYLFDLNQFGEIRTDSKRKSFIRFRDTLKNGFLKFINGRKILGRFFLIVCFIVACTVVFNLARLSAMTAEKSFLTVGRDFIQIDVGTELEYADLLDMINQTSAGSIIVNPDYATYTFKYENLYQGSGAKAATTSMSESIVPVYTAQLAASALEPGRMLFGRAPETNQEVAIDVWIADRLLADPAFKNMGIAEYADLANVTMYMNGSGLSELKIVGVTDTKSPIAILSEDNRFYFSTTFDMASLGTAAGDYTITDGVMPDPTKYEILMSETTIYQTGDIVEFNGIECEISGLFSSERSFTTIVSNALMQETIMTQKINRIKEYNQWGSYYTEYIYLYASDPDLAVAEINTLGFSAENTYDYLKAQNSAAMFRSMIFVIIGFMAIIIYIIFMMRSSMLSRIKEIGIYRSIGATKRDIYKIFFSEILAFTTIGSLTGYLIMTYIVFYIQDKFEELMQGMAALFSFPLWLFFAGIGGIYVINILFGMIPIFTLLRKTPSEINSKYDI